MKLTKFGGLDAVMTGGQDREGGGDGPLVVLLHGFGAPGEDLVPLWRVLDVPSETRFIFPAAPISIEGGWDGRAWWLIDMMRLQMAMMTGQARDLTRDIPEGLPAARAQMNAFLDEALSQLRPKKWVLGGFSQGAMLSLDVTLHPMGQKPDGLVLLSGTLLAEEEWLPRMKGRTVPVFQSHGMQDPLLPFAVAEQLRDHLTQAGMSVEWVPFRGQHEIPPPVLVRLGAFLSKHLAP